MIKIKSKPLPFLVAFLCITLAAILQVFNGKEKSDDNKRHTVELNLNQAVDVFKRELSKVEALANRLDGRELFSVEEGKAKYPILIYEQGELTYWTSNKYIPPFQEVQQKDTVFVLENRSGQYLGIRRKLTGRNRQILGLVPLYTNSQIDNRYLNSFYNQEIFDGLVSVISKHKSPEVIIPIELEGSTVFYIEMVESANADNRVMPMVELLLLCVGLVLLILGLTRHLLFGEFKWRKLLGFVSGMFIIRLAMVFAGFPRLWMNVILFDPQVFASSQLNPSLGDMSLHLIFMLYTVVVILFALRKVDKEEGWKDKKWQRAINVGLVMIAQLAIYQVHLIIKTIYHNSQLSLDISESITFDMNRIVVYLVVILAVTVFFLVSQICYSLFRADNRNLFIPLVLGSSILPCLELFSIEALISALIGVLYFLIILKYELVNRFYQINYLSFIYLFCGVMAGAALSTYSISYYEKERTLENKKKFAEHFLIENDILGEYLLAEAMENISNDAFIKSRIFSPFISNKNAIREKIERFHLNKYFDKYQVDVHLFNSRGQNFDNSDSDYFTFRNQFDSTSRTDYRNIFFSDKLHSDFSKRYIAFVALTNYGLTTGHVVLDVKLKKVIPDNVYPELLVDSRFLLPFENKNYEYAIYDGASLISQAGDFGYQREIDSEQLQESSLKIGGLDHDIIKGSGDRVVVVSSKSYPLYNVASNFSFQILILTFLIVIIVMAYAIYFYLSGRSLNYSARIQLYFNLAFFLPLFAVSVTTLSLVTASYKEEVEHEHFKKARLISRNIESALKQYSTKMDKEALENDLTQIANFSNSDANLFNTNGHLLATSQPMIYKKGVISEYLLPDAMNEMILYGKNKWTVQEEIGNLKHKTTYLAVKDGESGSLLGILSVPFFQSEFNLEKEKVEVFTTIMNIFTIVFVVFLVISYFASKWLTFPLLFITQKLKQTTLSDKNEPLQWDSDDEIGLMVSEYNKMVVNLEDSKKELAKTQKETAWRQIAQQVAHEIKNPITPMKLTLQQLRRKLGDQKNTEEVEKPVNTLLSQVDTLSDIATSFSSFAKMPIPEQDRYDLCKVVKTTVGLYESDSNDNVEVSVPSESIYSIGDEKLMGRILTNIILNAKQSDIDRMVDVSVILENKENRAMLTIRDNGDGIPEDIRDKVFIPNFTTKKTGSGIGLAVAKHGVEHSGGSIWFETEEGKGTAFYIELPKVN